MSRGLNLVQVGVLLMLEAPRRPRWSFYRIHGYTCRYLLNRFHQRRSSQYESQTRPLHEALAYVTGRTEGDVLSASNGRLLRQMSVRGKYVFEVTPDAARAHSMDGDGDNRGPIPVCYGPSPELVKVVYTVCKLLRPVTVIETGVGRGFTTSAILAALDENATGQLHSVELPSLYRGHAEHVGESVPEYLRRRWSLAFGPTGIVLPHLLQRLGSVDVFLHDSATNYHNQRMEYEVAFDHMKCGGVLISGMVNNDAFAEVAESRNCRWSIIKQSKIYPIGVLSKFPLATS